MSQSDSYNELIVYVDIDDVIEEEEEEEEEEVNIGGNKEDDDEDEDDDDDQDDIYGLGLDYGRGGLLDDYQEDIGDVLSLLLLADYC
ncbi:MAG: hypothetical protein EZS28_005363 [Streblomastix strix]|uniref:Uncharacterized protein n=1 Tax=Streblomastix strix TaxID=222440 RepID=A0A5J4WVS1_9EUKA|nr:MAG: hypothetical protein EZS28_005363 [Streblomastix strix]